MIYPHNYERKIGIDSIRLLLKGALSVVAGQVACR